LMHAVSYTLCAAKILQEGEHSFRYTPKVCSASA
jgi:hypothetical protein